jgi:hypothetical protein
MYNNKEGALAIAQQFSALLADACNIKLSTLMKYRKQAPSTDGVLSFCSTVVDRGRLKQANKLTA